MNVLIVEDYQPLTFVIGAMLRKIARRVEIAHTLADAMEWLAKKNGFDVVLLDLGLPDSEKNETIEAIERIKAGGRRVIVMTGGDVSKIAPACAACGADAFFCKNDPDFIESIIRQLGNPIPMH